MLKIFTKWNYETRTIQPLALLIHVVVCRFLQCGWALREGWNVGSSASKHKPRWGKIWHTMILVFAMWPYLKDDLSNDNKLNNETETR
jgi:hypothetical protein